MIAILNTSRVCKWADVLGDIPWPLLPVASRPLIDYWLEACTMQEIEKVQVVLGENAKQIEDFVGAGDTWGVKVEYAFARNGETAEDYLHSASVHWENGLFYIGAPFFMRRRQAFRPDVFSELKACRYSNEEGPVFLYGKNGEEVRALLDHEVPRSRGLERIHIHPYDMPDLSAYFELNMKIVGAELSRYVSSGVSGGDGSSIGYNVRTPPSCQLQAPLIIGSDCRFGMMTTVGPNVVIANHVIIDAHTELNDCLILSDTYIGRNLEIREKIVSGNRVIDPSDGTMVEIDDSWVVAQNRPEMRTEDILRYIVLWFVAVGLVFLLTIPFLLIYPILRVTRVACFRRQVFHDPRTGYISLPVFMKLKNVKSISYRLFRGLCLDRFPWLLLVLRGKLFLCGQPPMRHPADDEIVKQLEHYYPGVFCYQDYNRDSDRLVDSLWYAHIRSFYEDLKILIKALVSRFLTIGRQ